MSAVEFGWSTIRMRYLLILSLVACASSQPTDYRRGAYAPAPGPAPVRPGVGAPQVGQPGQDPAKYPKSPYGRVLPEDPETRKGGPGIWASEDDRSPSKKVERGPDRFVFGMGLPIIPEYDDDAIEQFGVFKCAQKIEDLIKQTGRESQWVRLPMDDKFCLLAQLYEFCSYKSREWMERLPKGKASDHWGAVLRRQIEIAGGFRKRSCVGDISRVNTLLELLTEEWDKRVGSKF